MLDFALGDVWSRPGLSRRDRSLIVVSMLTALNQERQLVNHARGALNHGVSPTELREILVQLAGYAGFPRALSASAVIEPVLQTFMGDDYAAPEPAQAKGDSERRKDAALDAIAAQMGAVGRYALDFAFGEIWSRTQLARRDRSLVVVSALSALGRGDELRFHIPGALRHGVTRQEIEELLLMVVVYAGFPFAVEATRIAREAFERLDARP